jgi:energy-coupling factor transporter ATP-binding protein EcfA2
MKLTRLVLHRFGDALPGELRFGEGLHLVLGENGTGRSTLLELLAHVLAGDFSSYAGQPFALDYEMSLPGVELAVSVRHGADVSSDFRVRAPDTAAAPAVEVAGESATALRSLRAPADSGTPGSGLHARVEVELALSQPASTLRMCATGAGIAWEVDGVAAWTQGMEWSVLDRPVWVLLMLSVPRLGKELRERLHGLLRHVFLLGPARFDEGLEAYARLREVHFGLELREGELAPLGLMHLPPWLARALRERVERAPLGDALEVEAEEAPDGFLARFCALAGFRGGRVRLGVLDAQRSADGGGRVELGGLSLRLTREDGAEVTEAGLGWGQRRLLTFLYYLDLNADFCVADELPAGLHPRWLEACVSALGQRQAFVSGAGPLLAELLPPLPAEALRRALVVCRRALVEGRERYAWEHPTAEQAAELARSPTALPARLRALGWA